MLSVVKIKDTFVAWSGQLMTKLIIVVDDNDGVTNVKKFTKERLMLDYVQYRNIQYISVYNVDSKIKLKKRSQIIIDDGEDEDKGTRI